MIPFTLVISSLVQAVEYGEMVVTEDIKTKEQMSVSIGYGNIVDNSLIDNHIYNLKMDYKINPYFDFRTSLRIIDSEIANDQGSVSEILASQEVEQKIALPSFGLNGGIAMSVIRGKMNSFNKAYFDANFKIFTLVGLSRYSNNSFIDQGIHSSLIYGTNMELKLSNQYILDLEFSHVEDAITQDVANGYNQFLINIGKTF